jgi:8-oxo-dGTP pyrophosphatase MutT (NUDIX family)
MEISCPQTPEKVDDIEPAASIKTSSQQQTSQGVSMAAKILNVDEAKLVRAAGGIICRSRSRGSTKVALIHRPGYDDWTFPKGKVDSGESLEETALREVEEETGYRCRLVRPLGCTAYADRRGRDKVACYWVMEVVDGRFRPGDEVDEIRWVTIEDAYDVLSYRRDRTLLRSLDLAATG